MLTPETQDHRPQRPPRLSLPLGGGSGSLGNKAEWEYK